jgi:ABC transporter substrate binding protein
VIHRRGFIAGVSAPATPVSWPLAARAQQCERVRRVGMLTGLDQSYQAFAAAFREGLSKLGWVEGHNLITELRFGAGDANAIRTYAAELVSLAPDVIVTTTVPATKAVQQQTRTIPIVFVAVGDPVDNGIVKNIARPEANATGVTNLFASFGGKWIALLKEAAPRVERVALVYNPQFEFSFSSLFPSIEARRASWIYKPSGFHIATPATSRALLMRSQLRQTVARPCFHHPRHPLLATRFMGWRSSTDCPQSVLPLRAPLWPMDRTWSICTGVHPRCRPHPPRRQGERAAGGVSHQVSACHQSQDREGARPHNPRQLSAASRRVD